MTVEIQYVKMPSSESMNAMVTQKLEKLSQKYDWLIRAQVHFKQENDAKGTGKICEIELSAPGPRLFAQSHTDNFEKSLNETLEILKAKLQKKKEVMQKH
ncbi:HPF/RaiA family ribosome-associated protein [Maribacter sp. 2307ULW6-5]|uniref:HPF/RaiA family ribosome-associated protein n=1 Tax=Maribacter sp. 2307ULW6-5 TaxID=3386275 RepID=UPI0039BD72B9